MKAAKNANGSKSKTKSSEAGSLKTSAAGSSAAKDADDMLKADHRKVEGLFSKFEQASAKDEKQKLAKQICQELVIHTMLEEEIFYPACRKEDVEEEMMDEAQVEHDGAKLLINELLHEQAGSEMYDAKVKVLSEYIKHHVGEEERPSDGIFASARREGIDMKALGQRLAQRKEQLLAEAGRDSLPPPTPRSLHVQTLGMNQQPQSKENGDMNRYSGNRDHDDRNRYGDDEHRGGGYSSRDRNERNRDDDHDRGNGDRQRGWSREYENYQSRSNQGSQYGSRYGQQGDDRYRGESGGESGWSRGAGGMGQSMGAGSMAYRGSGSSGSQGYGSRGGSSRGYGSQGYGSQGYGSERYGSEDYGSRGDYGSQRETYGAQTGHGYGAQNYRSQGQQNDEWRSGRERDWNHDDDNGGSYGSGRSGGHQRADYGENEDQWRGGQQQNRGWSEQGRSAQGQGGRGSEWDRDEDRGNRTRGYQSDDQGHRNWRNRD